MVEAAKIFLGIDLLVAILINCHIYIKVNGIGQFMHRTLALRAFHGCLEVSLFDRAGLVLKEIDDLLSFVYRIHVIILVAVQHDFEGIAVRVRLEKLSNFISQLLW